MADTYLSFTTERLLLRPTDESDAAMLLELFNSPKWLAFIGDRGVRSLADARKYVRKRMRPQLRRLGFSSYTIVRQEDGVRLGFCGLYDREGLEGIDLGFALLPQFEGKGYAYEAACRVRQAAWEDFGLQELSAITTPDNLASQRLLDKLGLLRFATLRLPGDETKLLHYRLSNPGLLGDG